MCSVSYFINRVCSEQFCKIRISVINMVFLNTLSKLLILPEQPRQWRYQEINIAFKLLSAASMVLLLCLVHKEEHRQTQRYG